MDRPAMSRRHHEADEMTADEKADWSLIDFARQVAGLTQAEPAAGFNQAEPDIAAPILENARDNTASENPPLTSKKRDAPLADLQNTQPNQGTGAESDRKQATASARRNCKNDPGLAASY
jgi:hypothetical protein